MDGEIDHVAWPEKSGLFKIVQIDLDGQPYIAFQNKDMEMYHRQILRRFLLDAAVLFGSKKRRGEYGEYSLPNPKGLNYTLVGAGECRLNLESKDAAFSERSKDYDMDINEASLDRSRKRYPEWSMYKSQ